MWTGRPAFADHVGKVLEKRGAALDVTELEHTLEQLRGMLVRSNIIMEDQSDSRDDPYRRSTAPF